VILREETAMTLEKMERERRFICWCDCKWIAKELQDFLTLIRSP